MQFMIVTNLLQFTAKSEKMPLL